MMEEIHMYRNMHTKELPISHLNGQCFTSSVCCFFCLFLHCCWHYTHGFTYIHLTRNYLSAGASNIFFFLVTRCCKLTSFTFHYTLCTPTGFSVAVITGNTSSIKVNCSGPCHAGRGLVFLEVTDRVSFDELSYFFKTADMRQGQEKHLCIVAKHCNIPIM